MKNPFLTYAIILVLSISTILASSCSKDEPESELVKEGGPFEFSELAGNWKSTLAYFLRTSDNLEVEVVGDGGSVSLTVQSNGKCTFTIDPFDCEAYTESGEMFWELYDEEYNLEIVWNDFPDESSSFRAELTDIGFHMQCFYECAEYDFNCDGTPETADLSFFFIRN
jgi:hypothetical protein